MNIKVGVISSRLRTSLDNLDAAFASLSEQALEQAAPLSRNNRDLGLFRRVRLLVEKENSSRPVLKKTGREGTINPTATVV